MSEGAVLRPPELSTLRDAGRRFNSIPAGGALDRLDNKSNPRLALFSKF